MMTKLFLTAFLSLCMASTTLCAQDITGSWQGKISLPTGGLTLVFHVSQTADGQGYTTTFDSPDQGAKGVATGSTTFQDSILTIQIPMIGGSYSGKLNADQTITGTFKQGMSLPLNLKRGEAAQRNRPQEPQPPFPYRSEEVAVANTTDGIKLAGTLTIPQDGNCKAAVVLITGSGAQNRDEEMMGHKPFWVIADYLTRNGIVVLRCDDRGTAASEGDFASATNEDFARDVEAGLTFLRSRKDINTKRIGVLGHSSGGTIAFDVAAADKQVAFVVSLAGSAVRGDSLMLKQVELISKAQGMPEEAWQLTKPTLRARYALLVQADKSDDELKNALYADVTKTLPAEILKDESMVQLLKNQVNVMTSPWYLHFMRYDPSADLQKIKCPVLALNGAKDIQVDAPMNIEAIKLQTSKGGNKQVTTKIYPQLNHLFQTCQKGTVEEYVQLEETISPEVLKDVVEWVLSVK